MEKRQGHRVQTEVVLSIGWIPNAVRGLQLLRVAAKGAVGQLQGQVLRPYAVSDTHVDHRAPEKHAIRRTLDRVRDIARQRVEILRLNADAQLLEHAVDYRYAAADGSRISI